MSDEGQAAVEPKTFVSIPIIEMKQMLLTSMRVGIQTLDKEKGEWQGIVKAYDVALKFLDKWEAEPDFRSTHQELMDDKDKILELQRSVQEIIAKNCIKRD